MAEKVSVGYVSRSHDFPKKEIFDGLHKHLKNAFGGSFPKKEFLLRKYLMAYISNSKMLLAKITKKGNFLKRKLYARNFRKMPEKSQKTLKKFPQV